MARGRDAHTPSQTSGRDAHAPSDAHRAARWYYGARLPHFDHPGAVQFITLRLGDSLPQERLRELEHEKDTITDAARRKRIEAWLDAGHGACFLGRPDIAALVEGAFQHFHGERYWLHAWVVMPNHVHVLIELTGTATLAAIVHSWKSYTAHAANRLLGRPGGFWMEDYWDRFIRTREHFERAVAYAHENPVKARLVMRPEDWAWSSARHVEVGGGRPNLAGSPGVPPGEPMRGRDAHAPSGTSGRDAHAPSGTSGRDAHAPSEACPEHPGGC